MCIRDSCDSRRPTDSAWGAHAAYSWLVSHLRVLVVGAGFSGIAMGAQLRRAGVEDFLILDKSDDVGGTLSLIHI